MCGFDISLSVKVFFFFLNELWILLNTSSFLPKKQKWGKAYKLHINSTTAWPEWYNLYCTLYFMHIFHSLYIRWVDVCVCSYVCEWVSERERERRERERERLCYVCVFQHTLFHSCHLWLWIKSCRLICSDIDQISIFPAGFFCLKGCMYFPFTSIGVGGS